VVLGMTEEKPVRKNLVQRGKSDRDIVLYDEDAKEIHVLNYTAFTVWELCDGKHSLKDIETIMRRKFSIDEDHDVLEDVRRVVDTLFNKGLLEKA
jgi:hypothetical protein